MNNLKYIYANIAYCDLECFSRVSSSSEMRALEDLSDIGDVPLGIGYNQDTEERLLLCKPLYKENCLEIEAWDIALDNETSKRLLPFKGVIDLNNPGTVSVISESITEEIQAEDDTKKDLFKKYLGTYLSMYLEGRLFSTEAQKAINYFLEKDETKQDTRKTFFKFRSTSGETSIFLYPPSRKLLKDEELVFEGVGIRDEEGDHLLRIHSDFQGSSRVHIIGTIEEADSDLNFSLEADFVQSEDGGVLDFTQNDSIITNKKIYEYNELFYLAVMWYREFL